jgi:hypothetical protein
MIWECQHHTLRRDELREWEHFYQHMTSKNVLQWPLRSSAETQLALGDTWKSLVSQYTKRRLTVASDKLPALSGIAGRFHARSDD